MKKLLLASVFVAFAVAVQAGDAKTSKDSTNQKTAVKADAACCSAKTSTSTSTTSTTTRTSHTAVEKDKMGCCSGDGCAEKTAMKRVVFSPKAASLWASK